MELEVGSILSGKVTGITKFGAFVTVAPGKSGLVHISEVANSYVSDIHEFLSEGQEVSVKVIGIDQNGRISLSIKQALPQEKKERVPHVPKQINRAPAAEVVAPVSNMKTAQPADSSFEDKLQKFMKDSDSKMSGLPQFSDKKSTRRRGGR